jgi:hypothetical protein
VYETEAADVAATLHARLVLNLSAHQAREKSCVIAVDRMDMPIIFITGHGDVPMTRQGHKSRSCRLSWRTSA